LKGSDLICLVRDWVPQSVLVQDRLIDRLKVVRGEVEDQELLERILGGYQVDTVFHLAQTIAHSYAVTFGLLVATTRCGKFYGRG